MGEENLKDFTINWAIFGLLFISLMAFTISFFAANNPIGLNDGSENLLNSTYSDIKGNLIELEGDTNELLNITASTNPETSYLGSKDSVSTSYKAAGTSKGIWQNSKVLISWVFTGDTGDILLGVFAGIIGFLSLYFITKWIRTGT
jgi:hypothetical protein